MAQRRIYSDKTDPLFVQMKEAVSYEYRLSVMTGKFIRLHRDEDLF